MCYTQRLTSARQSDITEKSGRTNKVGKGDIQMDCCKMSENFVGGPQNWFAIGVWGL